MRTVPARTAPAIFLGAVALLAAAALVDVSGTAGALPDGWPVVSYWLSAAGLAGALLGVLLRLLGSRRDARRVRGATLLDLLALGLLLGAWLLRGHSEIPPDPPLVAAALLALLLLGLAWAWRARLVRAHGSTH